MFTLLLFGNTSIIAQSIQIKDIQFRQGQHFNRIADEKFRYVYRIKSSNQHRSVFRKIDFNSKLEMLDTTLIELKGNYELLTTTSTRTHTATIFGTRATGTLLIHFIDNNTEQQRTYPFPINGLWKRKNSVTLYSSLHSGNIFVIYKSDARNWVVQRIDPTGKVIWNRAFSDSERMDITNVNLLQGNKLAFVKVADPFSRTAENEVVVLDGLTGNVVSSYRLYDEDSKSTVDNVIVHDSAMYVAGRKFFANRVSRQRTDLPYLRQIESEQVTDHKLTSALVNLKTYWMDVVTTNSGQRFLVGETFTNESKGAYFLKGVATGLMTLGMFSVTWTSMKFKQVAVIPLSNPDAPPLTLLQLEPRRVQLGSYTPAYPFAAYAYRTGQVRYWGSDNNNNLILMDGGYLKRRNLVTGALEELGPLPPSTSNQVVHTTEDYVIYLNVRPGYGLVEFNVVPFGNQDEIN